MKIPHSKLSTSKEDLIAVAKQVNTLIHAYGKKTNEFEREICKITKSKYAFAVQTGTAALHIALLALNIKKNDEVILPSYVCQSVLSAVNYTNATPILADIENNSSNISLKTIKPLITEKTKAIIVPHLFGLPANIKTIKKLKKPIIEDHAHSLGANLKIESDLAIFSFYATKMISTGHGGALSTNSKILNNNIMDLLTYDQREKYKVAYNYKLTNLQAALGLSQLNKLSFFVKRRQEIAKQYNESFKNLPIQTPKFPKNSVPFRYIINFPENHSLINTQNSLKQKGIKTEKPIFKPLHQYLNLPSENFPNTENQHKTSLSIPIYPSLTDMELNHIIKSVKESFR
jgi:perosamine synthetase